MIKQRVLWMLFLVVAVVGVQAAGTREGMTDAPRSSLPEIEWEVVPFTGIGPYTIGMTAPELAEALGDPDQVYRPEAGRITVYLLFREAGLSFHMYDQIVVGITSLSPRHAIENGPRVGVNWRDSIAEWEAALGRSIVSEFTDDGTKSFLWIPEFSVLLEMDSRGVITELNLEPSFDHLSTAAGTSSAAVESPAAIASRTVVEGFPPEHLRRLAGTSLSLDDYIVTEVTTGTPGTVTTYERREDPDHVTTGEAFLQAVPEIWAGLPQINDLVGRYGYPPLVYISSGPGASPFLNLGYDTGTLYLGTEGTKVIEVRFQRDQTAFTYRGIGVGSSLDDVLKTLGEPRDTIHGRTAFADRVLYLNPTGGGYLKYSDLGARFFFYRDAETWSVNAMYLFEPRGVEH